MDVVKAVETYITKMVSTPASMKVLLLDNHTVCRFDISRIVMAEVLTCICLNADTYRVPVGDAVHPLVAPGLPHGQDRQQEARPHATHEMEIGRAHV